MFGQRDPNTGLYVLPGWLSSVMTAIPFLGKALGCICAGALAERWGRRAAVLGLCISSIVGALLQVSAHSAAQFTAGRVITFTMTGMAIVVVPIYQAETAPKVLRGMFTSTIQLMIVLGQLIATLVTYGTRDIPQPRGWQIPVGLQLIIPVVILAFLPLLPESPRWLLSCGRKAEALRSLRKIRGPASDEEVSKEIEAIEYAHTNEKQGSWSDVFGEKHRVRTMVAVLVMFGQQITGQAFPSQYGVVFYLSQGFGSQAFLFNVISDQYFWSGAHSWRNVIVASLMMFSFFFNLSWAPISYVVVSETAALCVKEKTNLLACVVSVLTTFITSFTCPYLINPQYAGLGSKVGFVYGSFAFAMVGLAYFLVPELKGRTLEEADQLFESKVPLRKFGGVQTMTAEELYQGDLAPRGRGIGVGKLHDNGSENDAS
uniref:Major facilitator superfamily (MFS) profile domain-containing protein n=1 Tax=Bionectria ochroleuca TaxID=29856 RepID=A0A8H7NF02_BIOOC